MNKQVKSAARVLDVLELLASRSEPMRLNDLVVALGFPKSSTYGLLSTLVARGYVIKDSADRYAIGHGFGWVGGFDDRLRAIATPIAEEMRDRIGETVFVYVRNENQDARQICKAVSRHPVRFDSSDDRPLPAYGSLIGRVLLAYQPARTIDAYLARTEFLPFTDASPTTEAEIREELERIRRDGYGVIVDQYALGGAGIAAPIRNVDGKVVAVIDMATVTSRYEARRDDMLAAVLDGAARISARLGYRAAPGGDEQNGQTDPMEEGDA